MRNRAKNESQTTLLPTYSKNSIWKCWKLKSHEGRQIWHFDSNHLGFESVEGLPEEEKASFISHLEKAFAFDTKLQPNSSDLVYRSKSDLGSTTNSSNNQDFKENGVDNSLNDAIEFYGKLQMDDGHWPGDYGGPMFLLPGLIVTTYLTEVQLPVTHTSLIKQYMINHQNEDGGWGLHIEGKSSMMGSVMQYVALRLMGVSAQDPNMIKAQNWIKHNGGATRIAPWGKFFLALIGLYEWDGCNSLMPEMWLLPKEFFLHPSNYWCHSRMVYLPMAYCYGHKLNKTSNDLIRSIRTEIYEEPYDVIDWEAARNKLANCDQFTQKSGILGFLDKCAINPYEKVANPVLRKKALEYILDYVNAEDTQTNFINIGPINQLLNSICVWHAYGKESHQFQSHVERWYDYLWVAEDGMKMNGYNGSQLWDTAFAMQAILESGLNEKFSSIINKGYRYIKRSQIDEEVENHEKYFRHTSKGAWPFSTKDHGWPISDCTAEALTAALQMNEFNAIKMFDNDERIPTENLEEAVDFLLSLQNTNGGWATYEKTRSSKHLEYFNPSGLFKDIMIDHSYVECTSACLKALIKFKKQNPNYKTKTIERSIKRGCRFILSLQNKDGSWIGSWGICFTYGTLFGIEGLTEVLNSSIYIPRKRVENAIKNACDFLVKHQKSDGGWGESYESSIQFKYVHHKNSQVVNTSWAVMGLLAANYSDHAIIKKGIDFIISRQEPNGDFPQEAISGVFNSNCMITYTAYRNIFPIWALARYKKKGILRSIQ